MEPTEAAPSYDGKDVELRTQKAELRTRVTNPDPAGRASALVLRTDPVAHKGCIAAGNKQLLRQHGAKEIPKVLRDYFAPESNGRIY